MLALHKECLTLRYLLGRLDFLEGSLGFCSGIVCTLACLGKFGLLIQNVALQGLALLHGVLELLLDLTNTVLMLFSGGFFLYCSLLSLGQRLLEGLYLGRRP